MRNIELNFTLGIETDIEDIFPLINEHLNRCFGTLRRPCYYVSDIEKVTTYIENSLIDFKYLYVTIEIDDVSDVTIDKLKALPTEDGNYKIEVSERS